MRSMRVLAVEHQRDAGLGVFDETLAAAGAEVRTWRPSEEEVPSFFADAAIVLGGAVHPDQESEHPWLAAEIAVIASLLELGMPVLGVCLGAQLLARAAGGEVRRLSQAEIGWRTVQADDAAATGDPIASGLPATFASFQWHSYEALPPRGSVELARGGASLQAYRLPDAPAWGIQFHAEVTEEIVGRWLDGYATDPDAVAAGLEPEAVRRDTRALIEEQGRLGQALCERFLAVAATRA
jgi:GMP synthase-like glutamine amidotransferase